MKPQTEMIEGVEAAARMDAAMRTIFSVSRKEIQRREAEYKKQSDANPRKRGPKVKVDNERSRNI